MSLPAGSLKLPYHRVLLPRTRLAYVHLRNLFTDAKRDRSARVFGYVCVWLPDEFLLFFLQEGEIVNVTASPDGARFHPIAIADAVAKVPREAEYGEVCFHEADDEMLACVHWAQVVDPTPWPHDVNADNADAVIAYLHATMHDGLVEIVHDEARSYLVVRGGAIVRGYFSDDTGHQPEVQARALIGAKGRWVRARLWGVPGALPAQAAPALIQAYRDLMAAAVKRLEASGVTSAAAVAEAARRNLVARHPVLERMGTPPAGVPMNVTASTSISLGRSPASGVRDPVTPVRPLGAAMGAWLADLLWTAPPHDGTPVERFLEDLLRERRHMFQSAGLFDALPWKLFR